MDIHYCLDEIAQQYREQKKNRKATLDGLLTQNKKYAEQFSQSRFLRQFSPETAANQKRYDTLLDCLQVFSTGFQKMLMLRYALAHHLEAETLAFRHIQEEFGHNYQLMAERNFRAPIFDPVLDAVTHWFCWKMFISGPTEKVVIVNMVLEESSYRMTKVASKYIGKDISNYFVDHFELDADHTKLGCEMLSDLTEQRYAYLMRTNSESWQMIFAMTDRFCQLLDKSAPDFFGTDIKQ